MVGAIIETREFVCTIISTPGWIAFTVEFDAIPMTGAVLWAE